MTPDAMPGRCHLLLGIMLASAACAGPPSSQLDAATWDDAGSMDAAVDAGATPVTCAESKLIACEPVAGERDADDVILRGTVVTPLEVICSGDVLYSRASGTIECVGPDCSGEGSGAPVVCADIILPGFINAHGHLLYDHLPRFEHEGGLFQNLAEWQESLEYLKFLAAHDAIAGSMKCEIMKWAETRQIMAGTTSVVGSAGGACVGVLARNLDLPEEAAELTSPGINYAFTIPSANEEEWREQLANGVPFLLHAAEGVDSAARSDDWERLMDKAMLADATSLISGVALSTAQLGAIADVFGGLIWSPRSNISLYGLTVPVATARILGIPIAIGTDWVLSGSLHLLDELECAEYVNDTYLDGSFAERELVLAVTAVPAHALALDERIGLLREGSVADITVFRGDRRRPYRAILDAVTDDVALVVIGGQATYGDLEIMATGLEPNEYCEDLEVCGRERRICVKTKAGPDDPDRFDQMLSEIEANIEAALESAESNSACVGSECDRYELMPLYTCESTAIAEMCTLGNSEIPGVPDSGDADGDGVSDVHDLCVSVFDPPWDGATTQDDADGDGVGDACDLCPFTVETVCPLPDPVDPDGDSFEEEADNCPKIANLDQLDTDLDGIGDVCDACPTDDDIACMTMLALRYPADPAHPVVGSEVAIQGVRVTAIKESSHDQKGIWVQDPEFSTYGGVFVLLGSEEIPEVVLGQTVDVRGTYKEESFLSEIANPTFTIGEATLPLSPLAIADPSLIATGGAFAEPLEGMLVTITAVAVTSITPDDPFNYDEFMVTGGLRIDDLILDGEINGSPSYELGATFSSITGVLFYSFSDHKLEPRSESDLVSSEREPL